MISVKKDFLQIPIKLQSIECQNKVALTLLEKNAHKFASNYYREGSFEALKIIYHRKCAFCETDTTVGASLRVDHFRPKVFVFGDNNHLGYYWLGYEWSNLILICEKCNRHKSNKFPIAQDGIRVYEPVLGETGDMVKEHQWASATHFLNEKSLLLNPELDDVERHFIINSEGEWKSITEYGQVTENICKLNRGELRYERRSKINKLVSDIKRQLDRYINKTIDIAHFKINLKDLFDDLLEKTLPHNTYSRTYWFMFYKFKKVILPHIEGEEAKECIQNAFVAYLENRL